ncbi:phosphatidylethanolamine N-methyltransferase family protein [Albimonas sp. CAU 1670]|uniref:methyltransferase family protein n=1 Tax=Albimonas sp. CAU 1670 TaxID=3032599 RepID=UPI0023D9D6AC|nr:PEMT/PEM2 methyltransferase family protein [Albimonas sp. CAU 1670]MDF2231418.1 phosphatidylethanolamine N-methyltransferase family protein [Albimonas sp. CAU 1670]
MAANLVLAVTLAAAVLLGALLLRAFVDRDFAFWPSPKGSRHHAVAFGLFRAFCGGTVLYALLDWGSLGWEHWSRIALGAPLMLGAFAVTLRGYAFLGLDNTYCAQDGLVTGGIYAYSRNPQYVSSVLATVGLALFAGSWGTFFLAGALFGLYLLFALNEERWLHASYGERFAQYMREAPRFLDARSFRRAREALAA